MRQWIDFKALRASLKFREVLEIYGVKLNVKGDQAQGFCPLPGHRGARRSPSFSVNLARGIWQCFGCGCKGNVLDFAIQMEGLSPDEPADVRKVAIKLRETFNIEREEETLPLLANVKASGRTANRPDDRQAGSAASPVVKVNEPLDFELKDLRTDHPYLTSRGFSAPTIRRFGLGYCGRGLMAGRVAIPLHDSLGRLVGYAGRIVDDSAINEMVPKYKVPSRRERNGLVHEFYKSQIVYNVHRLRKPVEELTVVEGFPSVWWLDQAGARNVVALMGSSCSEEQTKIILEHTAPTARITVFPDGDEAGERFAHSVFAAIGPRRWIRWARLPAGKQPTDFKPHEVKQLLCA